MKRTFQILSILLCAVTVAGGIASAHAVVNPGQAGIGSFETFTLAVPSEKPEATVAVKLLIPAGLSEVTPNVKPGWKVAVKTGENDTVTEIDWTGGTIPASLRDEFSFSAQVPAVATTLVWKTYQTYVDGSVVSWDQAAAADSDDDSGSIGPYSTTQVVNDLTSGPVATTIPHTADWALGISLLALIIGLYTATRKKV